MEIRKQSIRTIVRSAAFFSLLKASWSPSRLFPVQMMPRVHVINKSVSHSTMQVSLVAFTFCAWLLSDIDDCISVTCNNGGTCQDGINSFTCVCSYGYTGKFCDTGKQKVYF